MTLKAEALLARMGDPSVLTGDDLMAISGPIVYAWKREGKWLYIGHSNRGLERLVTHDLIGRKAPLLPSDTIELWRFPTLRMAQGVEAALIKSIRPVYNSMRFAHANFELAEDGVAVAELPDLPGFRDAVPVGPITIAATRLTPLRNRVFGATASEDEHAAMLDAIRQAGYEHPAVGARVVLMAFARSAEVRDAVARWARLHPEVR